MRATKILLAVLAVILASGCSSSKKSSMDGSNIPVAGAGGELADVNFAFDSYMLDAVAKAKLDKNAGWLQKNDGVKVQIEGHCDERGTKEYNMVLGMNRARSVMDYLRSMGVSADRMSTVSYGEELPLDPRSNEEAWAKNRRVHFSIQ